MPSPFPGMDPYLEDPARWPDFHHRLISVASDLLTPQLRPKYYCRIEERVYVSDQDDPGRRTIVPDLRIENRPRPGAGAIQPAAGIAVAEPLVATILFEEEVREPSLEIVDRDTRHVITLIEVLSPTNKVNGARGQEDFLRKRRAVLNSPSHYVEIDLLRQGTPPLPRRLLPPCHYTILVSRVQQRPQGLIWPIQLGERLPVVPIPLRADDSDVLLDCQAALDTVYDRAAYDLVYDYRGEPDPPLSGGAAVWSDELLRAKGLR